MAQKKNKAVFVVKRYPYNHPDESEAVPVGSEVDLSHLTIAQRQYLVDRRLMEPTTENALTLPASEVPVKVPKLNKYGLPFGQAPKQTRKRKVAE